MAWALAQRREIGRKCTLCVRGDMADYVRQILEVWGTPEVPHLSWPRIAQLVREVFDTRTSWETVRNHFQSHEPEVYERLEARRASPSG